MGWIEKEQPTPFDDQPLPGLYFLDGNILARIIGRDWTAGQKYPMIAFPSGTQCDLWETSNPDAAGIVHIFGELDLPIRDRRDRAFEHASTIAEACGYMARKVDVDRLEVQGHDTDEHVMIIYDNETGQMSDIQPIRSEAHTPPIHPAHQLMTDELREQLPELYSNEEIGLDALAPVKYFMPDGGWTWYASEFDGDDLLFGLVIGFDIELGYFSVRELQQIRGPLGLQIERDLYYEPRSLRELQDQHRRERGANY